jgi:arylsulfatase A-like enzyme
LSVIGSHRPHGVLVACGPDIKAHGQPIEGDLMDLAPTALALLDVPIPDYMEGRVLTEAVRDSVRIRYAPAGPQDAEAPKVTYTEEELGMVERRLAELGYV